MELYKYVMVVLQPMHRLSAKVPFSRVLLLFLLLPDGHGWTDSLDVCLHQQL